jgi:hypothetical protein
MLRGLPPATARVGRLATNELVRGHVKVLGTHNLVPTLAGANIVLNAYLSQQYRPGTSLAGLARGLLPS